MRQVDQLNRKLGEALGFVCGGTKPRFKWIESTDAVYYFREPTSIEFKAHYWVERIGKCWLLAQWRAPELAGGTQTHSDLAFPVMRGGQYFAHPESALPPGVIPTAELTQNWIFSLDRQMTTAFEEHIRQAQESSDKQAADFKAERLESMRDDAPAFGNYHFGTRSGSVSYGGV